MSFRMITKTIASTAALLVSTAALLVLSLITSVDTADAASTAFVNNAGDLIINGDNGVQQVDIHLSTGNQFVRIEAADNSAVNYDFDREIRDIKVNLKGGNDTLSISASPGYDPPRNMTINMGSGHNSVWVGALDVLGKLRVTDGSGPGVVHFEYLAVLDSTVVNLGGGTNEYRSQHNYWGGSHTVKVSGSGRVFHSSVGDSYRQATVIGGNKSDRITFEGQVDVAQKLTITTKSGDDEVHIYNSSVSGAAAIRAGSGNDMTTLHNAEVEGPFSFRGDGGGDLFEVGSIDFGSSATFNGGGGTDTYGDGGGNTFAAAPTITSFEVS